MTGWTIVMSKFMNSYLERRSSTFVAISRVLKGLRGDLQLLEGEQGLP